LVFGLLANFGSFGRPETELDSDVRLTGVGCSTLSSLSPWQAVLAGPAGGSRSRLGWLLCLGLLCSLKDNNFLTAWGLAAPEFQNIS